MSSCCSPFLVWFGGGKERAASLSEDLSQICKDLARSYNLQDLTILLARVPLRKLARLACLSKELHLVYLDRVKLRDAVVAAHLESDFPADFREGLLRADTALPRDLVVDPPVRNTPLTQHY
jgi:hypothetical protein